MAHLLGVSAASALRSPACNKTWCCEDGSNACPQAIGVHGPSFPRRTFLSGTKHDLGMPAQLKNCARFLSHPIMVCSRRFDDGVSIVSVEVAVMSSLSHGVHDV